MTEYDWLSECCGAGIVGGKCDDCFENVVGEKVCNTCGEDWDKCGGKCADLYGNTK